MGGDAVGSWCGAYDAGQLLASGVPSAGERTHRWYESLDAGAIATPRRCRCLAGARADYFLTSDLTLPDSISRRRRARRWPRRIRRQPSAPRSSASHVVCVEMDKTLGGTCVNVGCIPSKALLQSSEHYEFIRLHAARARRRLDGVRFDLAAMMKRKDDVVAQNTKGVEFLFRKNKVTWARGPRHAQGRTTSSRCAAPTAAVTTLGRRSRVILATGSVPVELPFLKFDEQRVLSQRRCAHDSRSPEAPDRRRRRRDRARARLRVAPARCEGHGGRVRADDPARHTTRTSSRRRTRSSASRGSRSDRHARSPAPTCAATA